MFTGKRGVDMRTQWILLSMAAALAQAAEPKPIGKPETELVRAAHDAALRLHLGDFDGARRTLTTAREQAVRLRDRAACRELRRLALPVIRGEATGKALDDRLIALDAELDRLGGSAVAKKSITDARAAAASRKPALVREHCAAALDAVVGAEFGIPLGDWNRAISAALALPVRPTAEARAAALTGLIAIEGEDVFWEGACAESIRAADAFVAEAAKQFDAGRNREAAELIRRSGVPLGVVAHGSRTEAAKEQAAGWHKRLTVAAGVAVSTDDDGNTRIAEGLATLEEVRAELAEFLREKSFARPRDE